MMQGAQPVSDLVSSPLTSAGLEIRLRRRDRESALLSGKNPQAQTNHCVVPDPDRGPRATELSLGITALNCKEKRKSQRFFIFSVQNPKLSTS
jgi:hypothetical protein